MDQFSITYKCVENIIHINYKSSSRLYKKLKLYISLQQKSSMIITEQVIVFY